MFFLRLDPLKRYTKQVTESIFKGYFKLDVFHLLGFQPSD